METPFLDGFLSFNGCQVILPCRQWLYRLLIIQQVALRRIEIAMKAFRHLDTQNDFLLFSLPPDRDLPQRCFMNGLSISQLMDKMGLYIQLSDIIALWIVHQTSHSLHKPAADIAEEMMIQRGDRPIHRLEILPQTGSAPGDPVSIGRIVRTGNHVISQICLVEGSQHMENHPGAQNAGVHMSTTIRNQLQQSGKGAGFSPGSSTS